MLKIVRKSSKELKQYISEIPSGKWFINVHDDIYMRLEKPHWIRVDDYVCVDQTGRIYQFSGRSFVRTITFTSPVEYVIDTEDDA